jgi:co-chaperonin GroES (HSP10)|tara:strand:- start:1448 stop:1909 length:462 start_codon:yes stop_codon:yes gene_type:complete
MTKPTLLVPDYIADKRKQSSKIKDAYVKPEESVLDPTKIPKKAVDRLPQPTGWRVLILPYAGKKKTLGGLHIPDEAREREALATVVGYVLKLGPLAYTGEKYGDQTPWCKEGDWVVFGRYAGSRFKIEGGEARLLNDDEILARISSPDDILHF